MKTKGISLIITLLCTAFCCHDEQPQPSEEQGTCATGSTPSWLLTIISELEVTGNPGEVIRYTYNNEYVFLIDGCHQCPDYLSVVYSCDQVVLCEFGGIAGLNTCPDFVDKATHEKLIWKK